MSSIINVHDCYGCGLCAVVCPKQIISIVLNKDGFYEPAVKDISACVDCGLCTKVCSYLSNEIVLSNPQIHSYAAWSNDSQIRNKCSSGGIGFEIGRLLINMGYKVCAVRYDIVSQRAEHYIADSEEALIPSIGSKYIQSFTVDGFREIDKKGKYLITGTPCQIDSFRRYIRKYRVEDNFVLLDFFCHGVPSKLLWDKYIQNVKKVTGNITSVSWRNKSNGWHDSYVMSIIGEKGKYNDSLSRGDVFLNLFLGDQCLGKSCYLKCKYKYNSSSADLRIGDLWGNTYKKEEKGVSAFIAFTAKGNEVAQKLSTCTLQELPFEIVAEGQMQSLPKYDWTRGLMLHLLRVNKTFHIECLLNKVMRVRQLLLLGLCHPILFLQKIKTRLI